MRAETPRQGKGRAALAFRDEYLKWGASLDPCFVHELSLITTADQFIHWADASAWSGNVLTLALDRLYWKEIWSVLRQRPNLHIARPEWLHWNWCASSTDGTRYEVLAHFGRCNSFHFDTPAMCSGKCANSAHASHGISFLHHWLYYCECGREQREVEDRLVYAGIRNHVNPFDLIVGAPPTDRLAQSSFQKNRLVLCLWLGDVWTDRVHPHLVRVLRPEGLRRIVEAYARPAIPHGPSDLIPLCRGFRA